MWVMQCSKALPTLATHLQRMESIPAVPRPASDRLAVPALSPLFYPLSMDAAEGDALALRFELRFAPLDAQGRSFAFPCDAMGHVSLDALNERSRMNYLYARAVVGRELTPPRVCCISDVAADVKVGVNAEADTPAH
jgi:hypothetical protein